MAPERLFTVEELSVHYNKVTALDRVSFGVDRGDFIALIGVNGSGKTTLARSILGLLRYQKGRIVWHEDVEIGYVAQHTGVEDRNFPATVEEVVASGVRKSKPLPKWLNRHDKTHIRRMMEYFDIDAIAKKRIGALSGGQYQRALLARSMVMQPDVLILDEPINSLDQGSQKNFLDLLKQLNQEQDLTILMITHDVAGVEPYATRILYLETDLLFDGTFDEFCETQMLSPYIHTHPRRYGRGCS